MKHLKFLPEYELLISEGLKSVTRRPVNISPVVLHVLDTREKVADLANKIKCPYGEVGTVHVMGNGDSVIIDKIQTERLSWMSNGDAYLEGFQGGQWSRGNGDFEAEEPMDQFRMAWDMIYHQKGFGFMQDPVVWSLGLKLWTL